MMIMSEKTKPDQQASTPDGEPQDQVPEWLASQLRRMCDGVMAEPMPIELMALLDQIDKKERSQLEKKERGE
jgi:hypothetical protein